MTAAHYPLAGSRLAVEGRRVIGGRAHLIVRLPDGTPGTVELQATSLVAAEGGVLGGALLSLEGVRRLRRLLAASAAGDDGSGT